MSEQRKVFLYGDSLMRATMPDEQRRYHFHFSEFLSRYTELPAEIVNRSHFGATAQKGLSTLRADAAKGFGCQYALLEYGGNDSDFHWAEISAEPTGAHLPNTPLPEFREKLGAMTALLRANGVQPVLMTLPPISAERYFDFFCGETLNRENVLLWLGDVQRIYRHQELYSNAVQSFAAAEGLPLIDVRASFLPRRDLNALLSADGIHLSEAGYVLFFDTLSQALRTRL